MHAIVLVARAELRRRWLSLLVIGLMAGLAGGALASASALARRTATADDRLHAATNADDVRTLMIGGDAESTEAIGEEALALPGVATGRVALGGVARVSGDQIVYVSLLVGPERWGEDVLSPVLVDGRLPDPSRPDEVVLNEAVAEGAPEGFELGREVELRFLTVEEYTQWDASVPLEGQAGTQTVEIVGTVRHPGEGDDLPPLIGTPALAERVPDGIGVLGAALLQLDDGADVAAVREAVNGAGRAIDRPAIVADLPPMVAAGSSQQLRASTETTTDVITLGLVVLATMAALAGVLAVAQASIRHSSASGEEQSVQQAIGMTVGPAHRRPTRRRRAGPGRGGWPHARDRPGHRRPSNPRRPPPRGAPPGPRPQRAAPDRDRPRRRGHHRGSAGRIHRVVGPRPTAIATPARRTAGVAGCRAGRPTPDRPGPPLRARALRACGRRSSHHRRHHPDPRRDHRLPHLRDQPRTSRAHARSGSDGPPT